MEYSFYASKRKTMAEEACIKFDEKRKCFTHGRKRLKGLRDVLSLHLLPNYNYFGSLRKRKIPLAKSRTDPRFQTLDALRTSFLNKPFRPMSATAVKVVKRARRGGESMPRSRGTKQSGFRHGALVDKQLTRALNADSGSTVCVGSDAYDTLCFMEQQGFDKVCSQVPVGDVELGIATAVDAVYRHRATGKLWAIEFKSGYNGNWERGSALLKAPFQSESNAPCNQAQLQLAATVYLASRSPGAALVFDEAAVVLIQDTRIAMYPLESWAWSPMTGFMAKLRAAPSGTAKKKKSHKPVARKRSAAKTRKRRVSV